MRLYLTGLFFMLLGFVNAQTGVDAVDQTRDYPPDCECMNPYSLLGVWEHADSSNWRVQFLFHQNRFILASDTTLSGRHQFNAFEFFYKDSLSVSTAGVVIKWPPDYCEVKLLDDNNIEIQYRSSSGDNWGSSSYRRSSTKNK